jgi:hypothetical protein
MPLRPQTVRSLATAMPLIAALFRPHELPGIVIKLFPNPGMICEETLQARMSAVEIGIFDELGIRSQFLCRLGMVVQVSIEVVYLGRCSCRSCKELAPSRAVPAHWKRSLQIKLSEPFSSLWSFRLYCR